MRRGTAPAAAASLPQGREPRRNIARRVLLAFVVTLAAFGVTVGFSVFFQRRAAQDNEELAKGFVPVALNLGQLRATQATLATLVDGIPDERDPQSMRQLLQTLMSVRTLKLAETRSAITGNLRQVGSGDTRELSTSFASELDAAEAAFEGDGALFRDLFFAFDRHDSGGVNDLVVHLGGMEHDADRRLGALAVRVATSMESLSVLAKARERRSIALMIALGVLTLGVGIGMSLHVRRLLLPLAEVTARARAVAQGDRTPKKVPATDDEIGELAEAFEKMVEAVAGAQSQAVANERLAAIGKMAAHVTHEIRNPLSSINLNIELLEEELSASELPGEARSLLASITREVDRLGHLSEEYLRLARLPSPRMEADDVRAAVLDVTSFARPELERAGCELRVAVDDGLPPALFDEAQLRQALLNLLRNAREAMPDGGPVDVSVSAEGMSVVISVQDRGGGIPEAIRERVFDPFFSTKGEGTGLGLAITRQIVEAHGGTLTTSARDDGGTLFRVALPIAPARTHLAKPEEEEV